MGERIYPGPGTWAPERIVTVLAICDTEEDRSCLSEVFRHSKWRMLMANSCQEAYEILRTQRIPVVVCACARPDGCWKGVLKSLEKCPSHPLLVVASRQADDRLWAEVLNLGGYDVLSQPFDTAEIVRVIGSAWLHWRHHGALAEPLTYRATA